MRARTRRLVIGVTVATLIIALATMGGYRLQSQSDTPQSHTRLAATVPLAWVSHTGSDSNIANPNYCQYFAPCGTFSTAASIVGPGGWLGATDSGDFGDLNITRALTIDGGPGKALILDSGVGLSVSAGPNDVVTLRHLQIHFGSGAMFGINFVSGKALILDDVTIEGFPGPGLTVAAAGPASVTITNSHIQNNGQAGIAIAPSGGTVQVSISHSQIARNYYGIIAQDGADVSLTDSVVSGSTNVGVGCQTYGGGPCTIQTAHDRLDHNWAALWMNHASGNAQITETLSDDDLTSNSYGIYGDFGGTLSAASTGNSRFVNNTVNGTVTGTVTQM